jgi:hypothetical protein
LLYWRLAAIYKRPTALPALPIQLTPDHDAPLPRR